VKLLAATLIGACLAAGPALAQSPPDADRALDNDVMAGRELRLRLEVSPPLRIGPPRFDQTRAQPVQATGIDSRLWIGDSRTQLGFALRGEGVEKGMLLRTQLTGDAALSLRLRGGKVGLFVAVALNGRP
jgi:hypothetical protein